MRARRSLAAGIAGLGAFLVAAANAAACNEPAIGVAPQEAEPGATVSYSLINTEAGATYSVSVAGTPIVTGAVAATDNPSGSFTMPAVPAGTAVVVETTVAHDDLEQSPWFDSATVTALAPPAPPRAKPDKPETAPRETPAKTAPKKEARPREAAPAASEARSQPAATASVAAPPRTVSKASAKAKVARTAEMPLEAPRWPDALAARHPVVGVATAPLVEPATADEARAVAADGSPWWFVVALVALGLLAGAAGAAGAVARRRRARGAGVADPRELELQEMISEERARRLTRTPG